MHPWWLWRTKPVSKRSEPKVAATYILPWNYVSAPRKSHDWQALVDVMREDILPTLHRHGQGEHWNRADRGEMLAVEIRQLGRGGKQFMLTPPIEVFVDVKTFYPGFESGGSKFWIQPEVFTHNGNIYQGDAIDQIFAIDFNELQTYARANEEGGFILAALDAYLQTGTANPMFLTKK